MAVSTLPSRGLAGPFVAFIFIGLSALALKEMRFGTAAKATEEALGAVVANRKFENGQPLRDSFTAWAPLDTGISYLVAAFLPGVAGWDQAFRLQQIYFLFSAFPLTSILAVEAGRKRNFRALTSLCVLNWSFLMRLAEHS